MTFKRTYDLGLVAKILTEPRIWRTSSDDFSGKPEEFLPNDDPRIWYVRCLDGDADLGLMMFVPQSTVMFDVHCALSKKARGKGAEVARGAMLWMFRQSAAKRIVAHVPSFNRLAVKTALDAGMEFIGVNRDAFQKNGTLHDLLLFGISK